MDQVEKLVGVIRSSFAEAEAVYTTGGCYRFALILRQVYPDAEIWYEPVVGHVYTKIGKYWYDITGKHCTLPGTASILDHKMINHRPHRWK